MRRSVRSRRVKNWPHFQVLSKCSVRLKRKSLADCREIEASLFQTWNAQRKAKIKHPFFVKLLLPSHVSGGVTMPIPVAFCKSYLPREDTVLTLETESGEEYEAKYLARMQTGACKLSGWWRRFVHHNKLVAGDVLVFELIEATRFKVYFLRPNSLTVRVPRCSVRQQDRRKSLADCREIQASVMFHTWKAQRKPKLEHPFFVKLLLPSHVSGGCTLAIPVAFYKSYLPREDTMLMLETERGEEYEVKYIGRNKKSFYLSARWRRFVHHNKLVAGDVLVFELTEATRFKVYILRANSLTFRMPTQLLDLYTDSKEMVEDIAYRRKEVHSVENFSNIKRIEDFKTVIREFLQNQELPETILHMYYELCCRQNALLHEGISPELCTGTAKTIICETVGIAHALRTCDLSSFMDKFVEWEKSLATYEGLGMNVSFLYARLLHLQNLAFNSEGAADRCRLKEASHERTRVEDETRKLDLILASLRKISGEVALEVETFESKAAWSEHTEACSRLIRAEVEARELEAMLAELHKFFKHYDAVIETLKLKAKNHEVRFQEEANAPW